MEESVIGTENLTCHFIIHDHLCFVLLVAWCDGADISVAHGRINQAEMRSLKEIKDERYQIITVPVQEDRQHDSTQFYLVGRPLFEAGTRQTSSTLGAHSFNGSDLFL